jgi:cyclophilin family peptidyl-prolyl cis-trans isomerase
MEIYKDWGPIGVQRFVDMVTANYFVDAKFFRVVPGFIAQFGLSGDVATTAKWGKTIADDPLRHTNELGTLCFATAGPKTRNQQLFFNMADNHFLDKEGFVPIGKIIMGKEILSHLYQMPDGKSAPQQPLIRKKGAKYLKQFPQLSNIKWVHFIMPPSRFRNDIAIPAPMKHTVVKPNVVMPTLPHFNYHPLPNPSQEAAIMKRERAHNKGLARDGEFRDACGVSVVSHRLFVTGWSAADDLSQQATAADDLSQALIGDGDGR